MEGFFAQSLNLTTFPSSFSRGGLVEKTSGHIKILKISDFARCPHAAKATKLKICSTRAQASGPAKSTSAKAMPGKTDSKDDNLVFVAGATGRVGSRTVRELLKLGFRVRAGVRNAQRADTLIQSVKQMKVDATNASEGGQPVERLEIVECDLEKPEQIVLALGNASVVICSIGASEKEVFDITGPYRIDYMATKNLIDAATFAQANHFILVTSLGTNKVGFPAAILNLFWGVLIWKRKAEEALLASGLPYTIVRPGGMERPTDSFKETHNITLSEEDNLFGGLVSNLQIAELMAVMAKNRDLSYCKIVEVVAETTAPLTPMEELLAKIPSQRAVIYSPKEPDVAAMTDPAPSGSVVAAKLGITTQRDSVEPKSVVKQALSPYIVYDDLKPPSSPTPAQPGGQKSVNISDTTPKVSASDSQSEGGIPGTVGTQTPDSQKLASGSLSPYVAYEDLKPPTSPSPTPPNASNDKPPTALTTVELASASTESTAAEKIIPTSIAAEDPSREYPDFKSSTSPSPNAPSASLSTSIIDGVPEAAAESSNCPAQPPVAGEPHGGQHLAEPKSRPLSPYTMYEDLKPPASPTPSMKKF